MPRPKPPVVRLSELQQGDTADFFALLAERSKHARRDGKPYYSCRFRDSRRSAAAMIWADGKFFVIVFARDSLAGGFYLAHRETKPFTGRT